MNWYDLLWLVVLTVMIGSCRRSKADVPTHDRQGRLTTFPARW